MNTTTLNMTTLDGGNVIIKKGEGGGSTPPSGGDGGNKVVYLNVVPIKEATGNMFSTALAMCPGLLAVKTVGEWTTICSFSWLDKSYYSEISCIAILSDFRGYIEGSNDINSSTIIQTFIEQGAVEITETEFYNLD